MAFLLIFAFLLLIFGFTTSAKFLLVFALALALFAIFSGA